jgi:hypothetical protein
VGRTQARPLPHRRIVAVGRASPGSSIDAPRAGWPIPCCPIGCYCRTRGEVEELRAAARQYGHPPLLLSRARPLRKTLARGKARPPGSPGRAFGRLARKLLICLDSRKQFPELGGASVLTDQAHVTLTREARERLEDLVTAIRDSDTHRELMLFMKQFFDLQAEIRQYFSLAERAIVEKMREFREIEEAESTATPADELSSRRLRDEPTTP